MNRYMSKMRNEYIEESGGEGCNKGETGKVENYISRYERRKGIIEKSFT